MWRPRERDSDVVIQVCFIKASNMLLLYLLIYILLQVIPIVQVNMMLSPSNHSTSDDSSTVNDKCMTTERYAESELHVPVVLRRLYLYFAK